MSLEKKVINKEWPIKKFEFRKMLNQFWVQFLDIDHVQTSLCEMSVDLETKLSSSIFSQKTNKRICFSIMRIRKYLKLEIKISRFKYFLTVMAIKQIRLFVFWENLGRSGRASLLLVKSDL